MTNSHWWGKCLLLSICAVGSTLVGAVVFGQTAGQPDKKTVNQPKVTVKTVAIAQSELVATNAKAPIPAADRKPFTLAEASKMSGKTLTPDTVITLPKSKKTMKAQELVNLVNDYEAKMNEKGASLRTSAAASGKTPTGGLILNFKKSQDAAAFAKQKEVIVAAHKKASADKEKQVNAEMAKFTKANLANELKVAKDNDAQVDKNRQALIAQLKKFDTKKLSAGDKKVVDHFTDLLKKPSTPAAGAKADQHSVLAAHITDESKQSAALIAKTKFTNVDLQKLLQQWFANTTNYDKVFPWHWGIGTPDHAEVHIDGKFEIHGSMGSSSSALSTKGSLKVAGTVLSDAFTVLDVEGSLSTSKATTSTSSFQLSAKLFGSDIFTPINDSTSTESKSVDHDFPFDITFVKGTVTVVFVPVSFEFGLKGDCHVISNDVLSTSLVSTNSSVTFNASLYGSVAVDLELVSAGLTGTLNLVNEKLVLFGSSGISSGKGPVASVIPPHLDINFSVQDTLSLLSGELDLFVDIDYLFGSSRVGTIKLFSFGGFTPVNGYLVGPDHIVIPQPLAVSAK